MGMFTRKIFVLSKVTLTFSQIGNDRKSGLLIGYRRFESHLLQFHRYRRFVFGSNWAEVNNMYLIIPRTVFVCIVFRDCRFVIVMNYRKISNLVVIWYFPYNRWIVIRLFGTGHKTIDLIHMVIFVVNLMNKRMKLRNVVFFLNFFWHMFDTMQHRQCVESTYHPAHYYNIIERWSAHKRL